jgi:dihydroorotate dehydrogenase
MLYSLVKPILFSLDPELAHDISLQTLQQLHRILPTNRIEKPTRVMGLDFPNPVGLAAGLDKNADYLDISMALENSALALSKLAALPPGLNPATQSRGFSVCPVIRA